MAVPAAPADNNIAATQASNAAVAAANPNIFGASSSQPAASSTTPNFNNLNSTNLQPTAPVTLPPPPTPNTAQANGLVGAGTQTSKSVQDYINQLTPTQPGPASQAQQTILDQIASLTGQDSGKDQALLDAQNASGATADQASLTSLNNQLLTQTAQYNNEQANLGGNGSVETSAVLAAQNAGLTKARAADIGLTTAQIQAAQGNLALAMNTAQQAVNAKYSTIEDNIKTSQAQLAAIQPMLDAEQKTTALAQAQVLQDQANAVAAQKDKETQINNVALQAAQAGASPAVLAAINGSTDVVSAIAAAAPALGAKVANDLKQQTFENSLQLRTAANDATRLSIEQQAPIQNLAEEAAKNGADAATIAKIASSKTFTDALGAASTSLAAPLAANLKAISTATITTASGQQYINGASLTEAQKTQAENSGVLVVNDKTSNDALTNINNAEQQLGTLLDALTSNGVDFTKLNIAGVNQGATGGFFNTWTAGNATPALRNFTTALTGTNKTGTDGLIGTLSTQPNSGALVATLQNNIPSDKDDAKTLNTKLTNIKSALITAENGLLVDNSKPSSIVNAAGQTLRLQPDGTYE